MKTTTKNIFTHSWRNGEVMRLEFASLYTYTQRKTEADRQREAERERRQKEGERGGHGGGLHSTLPS